MTEHSVRLRLKLHFWLFFAEGNINYNSYHSDVSSFGIYLVEIAFKRIHLQRPAESLCVRLQMSIQDSFHFWLFCILALIGKLRSLESEGLWNKILLQPRPLKPVLSYKQATAEFMIAQSNMNMPSSSQICLVSDVPLVSCAITIFSTSHFIQWWSCTIITHFCLGLRLFFWVGLFELFELFQCIL